MARKKKRGKVWHVFFREDGKKKSESLGTRDGDEADHRLAEWIKRRGKTSGLIGGYRWDTFRSEIMRDYTGSTVVKYNNAFNYFERFCRPTFVDSVTYRDAKHFRSSLIHHVSDSKGTPLRPSYVNTMLKCLRHAWVEAVKMKYAEENIFAQVEDAEETTYVPRYLKLDEILYAKPKAKAHDHRDFYLMFLLAFNQGLRRSEFIHLKWASIDFEKRVLFIHGDLERDPKDKEESPMPLKSEVLEELQNRVRTSPYVLPGPSGGPRDKDSVTRLFNRFWNRIGLKNYRGVHIGRHTLATHMQAPERVKQTLMRHSDIRTTRRYGGVPEGSVAAVENMPY